MGERWWCEHSAKRANHLAVGTYNFGLVPLLKERSCCCSFYASFGSSCIAVVHNFRLLLIISIYPEQDSAPLSVSCYASAFLPLSLFPPAFIVVIVCPQPDESLSLRGSLIKTIVIHLCPAHFSFVPPGPRKAQCCPPAPMENGPKNESSWAHLCALAWLCLAELLHIKALTSSNVISCHSAPLFNGQPPSCNHSHPASRFRFWLA